MGKIDAMQNLVFLIKNFKDAVEARQEAEISYFGEFSPLLID